MAPTLKHEDYTVGWICALPVEMTAAQAMLDHHHTNLAAKGHDNNTYQLGSIGVHNVVMACLPSGVYGTTSAATVAAQMLSSFGSIRFGLMVGVGGGIPGGENDIRLGDIVVSKPMDAMGGVIQYRSGKIVGEGRFVRTGSLNKPPPVLGTAVNKLQADHLMSGTKIPENLAYMQNMYPKMADQFSYQGSHKDRLFEPDYVHQGGNTCDGCNTERIVPRALRQDSCPLIHYGLIGSDNVVMKDGLSRDELREELGVICFDMEAAGLMDNFPCLVIRGICDYADTHKNKFWQPYAAVTAAAYAKELLSVISGKAVAGTQKASEATHQSGLGSYPISPEIDLTILDQNGRTPLHIAAHLRDEVLVEQYVSKMSPREIGKTDIGGFTALHLANGNETVVRVLLEKMRPEDLGAVNSYMFTVLDEAVMSWPPHLTDLVLEKMRPEDITRRNPSGWTALHLAAMNGREDPVPFLLAKMQVKDIWAMSKEPKRQTALHMAAEHGYQDIVDAMAKKGDPEHLAIMGELGQTALHLAADKGYIQIVRRLLDTMDADDVVLYDHLGESPLHKAAKHGHRAVVKLLLDTFEEDEDINAHNGDGETAQDLATKYNHRRIASLIQTRLNQAR